MSRIGYQPIPVPSGVKVSLEGDMVKVEGSKAKLSKKLPPLVSMAIEGDTLKFERENETKTARSMHGLARSLVAGMVEGVDKGFKKDLEIIGVGYKAQMQGSKLTLTLGFSHPVEYDIPEGVAVSVENNTKLAVEGADKQMVGEVAATIRRFKKPEPYKGKGIRYVGERVVIKEGKTVG
ncbi:MAG: 50S ribosomal protein L6 [Kiritimatiellaeota bacterium]|nr:50S ribosomal protein L6 [Kiritimatiellota bacterium]